MNQRRHSTLGLGFALLVAACGSESNPGAAGGGNTSTGGTAAAGQNGGGVPGPANGGTTAKGTGGASASTGGSPSAGTDAGGSPAATGGSTSAGDGGTPSAGTAGTDTGTGGSAVGMGGSAGQGSGGAEAGAAGGPPNEGGGAGTPPVINELELVTSGDNAYWKEGTLTEATGGGNADVTVNENSAKQTFTGFGGTFNERGWEALEWLSEADRANAIKLLFDAADGAKFTYGRIPIGASDYASGQGNERFYTLDDGSEPDPEMQRFSIERDKERLIPYIKAALAVKPDLQLWASPWTPPPWMKSNGQPKGGNMKDDPVVLDAFALYLAKFVEEYGKEGMKIMAIHPQNEPGFVQDYPSCNWTGALMAKFIGEHLGPTFTERNVEAQIFVGTMSHEMNDSAVLNAVAGNAAAMQYVKGYGLQWGMINQWGNLNMDASLAIWQTEHKCGNYPWMPGYRSDRAPNDHAYAVESWGLIRDWIRRGVTSYSAWNMVLDPLGKNSEAERDWKQNALMTVDEGSKQLTVTPTYYVFRHVSQYVDPGAKVLGVTGEALAFKNPDGSVVTVVYNSGAAKMMTVAVGEKRYQFNAPGNGWVTLNPGL